MAKFGSRRTASRKAASAWVVRPSCIAAAPRRKASLTFASWPDAGQIEKTHAAANSSSIRRFALMRTPVSDISADGVVSLPAWSGAGRSMVYRLVRL
jgi:hypothetical protein